MFDLIRHGVEALGEAMSLMLPWIILIESAAFVEYMTFEFSKKKISAAATTE